MTNAKRFSRVLCCAVTFTVLAASSPVVLADDSSHEKNGAHSSGPVTGELGFWTLFVFAGLLFVLGKFAWKPMIEALDKREKHLRETLEEAERARVEASRSLAEHAKKLAEVQTEVRAILDEARRDAQQTQQEIMKQAQAEAQATSARRSAISSKPATKRCRSCSSRPPISRPTWRRGSCGDR